ncbi:MAG: transposase [Rhodobacteraceae bacterium]|nr:transposase [Paracoccaceae bacterium]
MGREKRRTFTDEFNAAAVKRLYQPGATQGGVATELGVTSSQLKTWRLVIEGLSRLPGGDPALRFPVGVFWRILAEENVGHAILGHVIDRVSLLCAGNKRT